MTPKPRSPIPIRVEIWDTKNRNSIGADPALVATRPEALRASALTGNDPGYWLGVYVPRLLNRIADRLVLAVFIALCPVSIFVWMHWL